LEAFYRRFAIRPARSQKEVSYPWSVFLPGSAHYIIHYLNSDYQFVFATSLQAKRCREKPNSFQTFDAADQPCLISHLDEASTSHR
jgi:hypothetical protein